ncbi:MAG: SDR family oxidoreductase [Polyangiales bacterium]
MDWANTSVLITGASRGLGLALARALGKRGARLALVSPNADRLQRAIDGLASEGIRAHGIRADIGDKHAIHPIVGRAHALIGDVDVVIHNASTLGPVPLAPLLDTACEDFTRALDVNVVGPFRLTKALASGMMLRERGLVVHVSSDAAVSSYPDWGAYAVSKAALDHLGRQLAVELADTGVRVLSIDPGEMNTDMHRDAIPDADPAALRAPDWVAARVLAILGDAARHPSGSRVIVADAEVQS